MARIERSEHEQYHRDELAGAVRASPKPTGTTIQKVRWVVTNKQFARIDGLVVDLTTANVICVVHDALRVENQQRFAALPIRTMARVAWKLVK